MDNTEGYILMLRELRNKRINNTEELRKCNIAVKNTKELIATLELDLKVQFNATIDERDPRYSNAAKRKVELEKVLSNNVELQGALTKLSDAEFELERVEKDEKILKLQERYLFKEIDMILVENTLKEHVDIYNQAQAEMDHPDEDTIDRYEI
jgi:hypothetical protein